MGPNRDGVERTTAINRRTDDVPPLLDIESCRLEVVIVVDVITTVFWIWCGCIVELDLVERLDIGEYEAIP